jgi:ubiquinone/menaquinone biosynthesis C-methylase UbiE
MTTTVAVTPDKVMQIITGGWASAILGAAARHRVFDALEAGTRDVDGVASRTGISKRGAQAVLDGLAGLGLVTNANGTYRNTPEASAFLTSGKPSYLGAMAQVMSDGLTDWSKLPEAVKTGNPAAAATADLPENPFWEQLTPAIAALSYPVAQVAAERLGIAKAGAIRWLDVGGGSGVWSAVWLGANPAARGVQLDWPNVNQLAKEFVARHGVGDRFSTIDGDFHHLDFGKGEYDVAILGHIAHQETPESNVELYKKFHRALKPGGTLVINDFVLDDQRSGHPFAMLFASQMVLVTKGGLTWRQSDYRQWLSQAGFTSVEFVDTHTPSTVVLGKR